MLPFRSLFGGSCVQYFKKYFAEMAKAIQEIYDLLVKIYTNKGATSYIDTGQFTEAVKQASRSRFREEVLAYQINQTITDDMSPFVNDPTTLVLAASGIAPFPALFFHPISITYGVMDDVVEVVDQSSWPERKNSELMRPNDYPICIQRNAGFEFFPKSLSNVKLTFFKLPIDPEIVVTYSNGREVIDWAATTDIEWKGDSVQDITRRVLESFAVNMKDPEVMQFSQSNKG
jgi:hypothetical protein